MSEFFKKKPVQVAAAVLLSTMAVSACSHSPEKTSAKPSTPSTSVPPLAKPGEAFSCIMRSKIPETLAAAGIAGAAQVLSPTFHETPAEIATDARYGIALCARSINKAIAKESGIVVDVKNIDPEYTCLTWTAVYNDRAAAQKGGLTNHIGLICVPPAQPGSVVENPQVVA